jgi:DNA-binding transcriptional regulator YhcF (GntR family)
MENETLDLKNRPLERIFQNSIARIIDFFIINQNFNFSTNEISELSDVPLRTIQRIIPQLVEKEIIKEVKRSKKNKAYELNKDSELAEILNKYAISTMNSFINDEIRQGTNKNVIELKLEDKST